MLSVLAGAATIFAQLRRRFERYEERQPCLPGITGGHRSTAVRSLSNDVRRKLELDLE